MTEAEAKTRWCPMARVLYAVQGDATHGVKFAATNQFQDDYGKNLHSHCIGSACMMWRKQYAVGMKYDATAQDAYETAEDRGEGFCGLAGKP